MNNDPSVMIMPGSMAVGSARVESELLHYLDVSWQSIIAGDIDGPESTPYKIDRSAPNLNRCSATRRVARAIFMGTAPCPNSVRQDWIGNFRDISGRARTISR